MQTGQEKVSVLELVTSCGTSEELEATAEDDSSGADRLSTVNLK